MPVNARLKTERRVWCVRGAKRRRTTTWKREKKIIIPDTRSTTTGAGVCEPRSVWHWRGDGAKKKRPPSAIRRRVSFIVPTTYEYDKINTVRQASPIGRGEIFAFTGGDGGDEGHRAHTFMFFENLFTNTVFSDNAFLPPVLTLLLFSALKPTLPAYCA